MDVSESRMTVTNPNTVPVRAKVIALIATPGLAAGSLFEYGVPSTRGLRSDGGLDYSVEAGMTVPPGASVEMAARMLTRTPTTVRALYGFADILAPNTDKPCNIPVAGAEPIKLLGGKTAGGCTDPAVGC